MASHHPISRALVAALYLGPLSWALPWVSGSEIHVAPAPVGNDGHPGTFEQPVATPQRARDLARALLAGGLREPLEVIFAGGTYWLDAPLELRPEDSGTAAFPVTWKAAAGAEVVLSGGRKIDGTWTRADDGTWRIDVPGTGLGAGRWNFRQLFVNGNRATRARFPNRGEANPYLYATGGGLDHVRLDPARINPLWGNSPDVQINIVPQSRFFNQWNTITAVDPANGRIAIADSERHRTINRGSWFWIEGAPGDLDEAGEWFLDAPGGRLFYRPEPGVDPNTLVFIAPFLDRIVTARGDVNAGTHVRHVRFDGLRFRHTRFTLGHIEPRVHTDAAMLFENTLDCLITNCHFAHLGGYALWLHLDSRRNRFDRNTVVDSGGGGVLMTGARFAYMDESKVHTPGEAAAKVFPILNEITRNTVRHCGRIRYYGGGVHLDSRPFSMSMAPGNRIAWNDFNDLSRNGVFAFRNQGGNVVEYNRIHNAMQTTIDGAAVHFATMNHLNAPNFILNNWLHDIWGNERKPDGTVARRLGNGVFLDWDTSNTTVKDNWIYNTVGGAVKTIWDNRNLVLLGNESSDTPITPPFAGEVGPDGTATHAMDLGSNRLIGGVIHHTDSTRFAATGAWTRESAVGLQGLFVFNFLVGTAAQAGEAVYTLPIAEDGNYRISLLYKPAPDRATSVPISITHHGGTANLSWNMRKGNIHGFANEIGIWRFLAGANNTITLSTTGTDGKVIADAVAFVKVADNSAPVAAKAEVGGPTAVHDTLAGSYVYSDADGDPEADTRFQWYRRIVAAGIESESPIPGATGRTYRITEADRGSCLFFQVTPLAATGTAIGCPVSSQPVRIP